MTDLPFRPAGKRGVRESHRPSLMLSSFVTLGTPPPSGDITSGIVNWGMDGNTQFGDCGPAATDHYMVAKSADTSLIGKLGGVGPLRLYFEYGRAMGESGHEPDEGVTNATWLAFLYKRGIIGGYAELNAKNASEVHQAMIDFRGVLIAVTLTDDAESLFSAHQPWTLAHGETPDPSEGHDILLAKYDAAGDTFVTWGGLQASTVPWDDSCITDAWVMLSHGDAAKYPELIAEIEKLHGTQA